MRIHDAKALEKSSQIWPNLTGLWKNKSSQIIMISSNYVQFQAFDREKCRAAKIHFFLKFLHKIDIHGEYHRTRFKTSHFRAAVESSIRIRF